MNRETVYHGEISATVYYKPMIIMLITDTAETV